MPVTREPFQPGPSCNIQGGCTTESRGITSTRAGRAGCVGGRLHHGSVRHRAPHVDDAEQGRGQHLESGHAEHLRVGSDENNLLAWADHAEEEGGDRGGRSLEAELVQLLPLQCERSRGYSVRTGRTGNVVGQDVVKDKLEMLG